MYPLAEAVRKSGDMMPLCAAINNLKTLYGGNSAEVGTIVRNSVELGRGCETFALRLGCGLSP